MGVRSNSNNILSCTCYYIPKFHQFGLDTLKERLATWIANENINMRFVSVKCLPRNSLVEVQVISYSNNFLNRVEEDNLLSDITYEENNTFTFGNNYQLNLKYTQAPHSLRKLIQIHIAGEDLSGNDVHEIISKKLKDCISLNCNSSWQKLSIGRIFYSCSIDLVNNFVEQIKESCQDIPISILPVSEIYFPELKNTFLSLEFYQYE